MIVFITGGAKNGKSSLAQDIALKLADGGKRYYIATMIPADTEDELRIQKHIHDRDGMGFETVEVGRQILSCLSAIDKTGSFLLDSATALLLNELFPDYHSAQMDVNAGKRCAKEISEFAQKVRNIVIVSDYIYSDAARYDVVTECYRKNLALIDRTIAAISDTVIEVSCNNLIYHKGGPV